MKKVIIDILLAASSVTDLVGQKVFPVKRSQETPDLPAIAVISRDFNPYPTKDKTSVVDQYDIELLIFADTPLDAEEVAVACRAALEGYIGTVGDYQVEHLMLRSQADDFENDVEVDVISQNYLLRLATNGAGPNYPAGVNDPVTLLAPNGTTFLTLDPGSTWKQGYVLLRSLPSGSQLAQIIPPQDGNPDIYDIQPATVVDSAGTLLATIETDDEAVINDSLINNHRTELVAKVKATQSLTLSAAVVERSDGVELTQLAPGDRYQLRETKVIDSLGATLAVLHPVPGSDTYTVSGATGIVYRRPPFNGQLTSYATGDVGWHCQNGTFAYNDSGDVVQELDHAALDPLYALKYENTFGNFYRFTDSEGAPATDNKAAFDAANFTTNRPTAIPYYVIDHLTGLGWHFIKIGINQNWNTAIATANAFSDGTFSDYRMPSSAELMSVISLQGLYYDTENIFENHDAFASGTELYMWLSDTDSSNTANAYRYVNNNELRRIAKSSTSFYATYACRNHY